MRMKLCLPVVAVSVALLTLPVKAAVIHVPDDQPTIQAGIDAASSGDTVLVACGTYYEHDIEVKSGVCLTSETGLADCATIDAQQEGRVFYCNSVDNLASIVGFTITDGLAGPYPDNVGGGMYCYSSSPTVTGCTFVGNEGYDGGGGMYCYSSSPTVTGCTFVGNEGYHGGGGMYCYSSSPTVTGCTFAGNYSAWGGGMLCKQDSSPTLTGCVFENNIGEHVGGGMYCRSSSPTLTGCTFEGNRAFVCCGGGLAVYPGSSPTLTGCTFSDNAASEDGGGLYVSDSSLTLTGCIIAFSTEGVAVSCGVESSVSLTCCDIYGNAGGDWVGCIADQFGVNGNFSEDPLFCLEDNPEEPYSLHEGSPCLPENSPCGELVGAFGEGCGPISPVEDTSWGAIKAMYR